MTQAKKIRLHYDLRKGLIKRIEEIDEEKKQAKKIKQNQQIAQNNSSGSKMKEELSLSPEIHQKGALHMFMKKLDEMSSEQSSEADIMEEFDLVNDFQRLREEAEKGCKVSQKIWERIDQKLINRFCNSKHQFQITPIPIEDKQHLKDLVKENQENKSQTYNQEEYFVVQDSILELSDNSKEFKTKLSKEIALKDKDKIITKENQKGILREKQKFNEEKAQKSKPKDNTFEMKTLKDIALTKTVYEGEQVEKDVIKTSHLKKKEKRKSDRESPNSRKHIDELWIEKDE